MDLHQPYLPLLAQAPVPDYRRGLRSTPGQPSIFLADLPERAAHKHFDNAIVFYIYLTAEICTAQLTVGNRITTLVHAGRQVLGHFRWLLCLTSQREMEETRHTAWKKFPFVSLSDHADRYCRLPTSQHAARQHAE
jgi:hypothetical protein